MKEILFASSNQRKINEANDTLETFGISVKSISIDIHEIQHHDASEITKAKAVAAYAELNEPVVVSDTSWSIPALGGFPGGYMKDVAMWWSEKDWLNIMASHDNKAIELKEHLAFYNGSELKHFFQSYEGVFLDQPRGPVMNKNESFERVASLDGVESLAEGQARRIHVGEKKQLAHWQQFGEWFTGK